MSKVIKRKAFVTGANGFVGSHLVDYLLSNNFEVTCLVRKSANLQWLKEKDVNLVNTGFENKSRLVESLRGMEYVFHVAGVVKAKNRYDYFKGNAGVTKDLLEACLTTKESIKRIVIVSSETAAGPSRVALGSKETDISAPITSYGISKLAQERLSLDYQKELPITIVRPPAVYGERDTEIFIFFNSYNKGVTTTIGFEKKLISLIHVNDLVRGIFLSAMSETSVGQTYFITSNSFYTWEEIIEKTKLAMGKGALRFKIPHSAVYLIAAAAQFISMFQSKPATLNLEKARDITQSYWICSHEKAKADFGFETTIDLEEGIHRTINWYRSENWF